MLGKVSKTIRGGKHLFLVLECKPFSLRDLELVWTWMVTIRFTKQELKTLRKGSILLRMLTLEYIPDKNFNTEQLYIVPSLSFSYFHSYDAPNSRWAPPLYEIWISFCEVYESVSQSNLCVYVSPLSVSCTFLYLPPLCVSMPPPLGHGDYGYGWG